MSDRSDALAARFEQANQDVIGLVSTCPAGDLAVICPAEGWTAAALGAHIAYSYAGIVSNLINPVVDGQEIPPFELSVFDEPNARAAADNAAMPQDQVVQLLRDNGATATDYIRGLSDADLDRTTAMSTMGGQQVSAEKLIELVLIGHTQQHGASLGQGLG